LSSPQLYRGVRDGEASAFLPDVAESLIQESVRLTNSLSAFVSDVSFSTILAAVGTSLVLAIALEGTDNTDSPMRMRNWFAGIKRWVSGLGEPMRTRIVTALVLLLGAYLSLAAIIAIPWIEGASMRDSERLGKLRADLQASMRPTKDFEDQWTNTPNVRLTDLSEREIELFQDDLVRWYRNVLAEVDRTLREARSSIRWETDSWRRWASVHTQRVEDAATRLRTSADAGADARIWTTDPGAANELFENLEVRLDSWEARNPPSPREFTGLGVFGYFANWLVESRSLPLALISGMVGVGLFGSVLAREVATTESGDGSDGRRGSLDVILVGISTAIIIFLAVQGGLAILSTGDTTPNAYLLRLGFGFDTSTTSRFI